MQESEQEHSEPEENEAPVPVTPRRQAFEKSTKPREIGGPKGAEPTRFGDWERAGRCIDF